MSSMMWDNGYGWGGWLAMSLGVVAFWAVVAAAVVVVVRTQRQEHGRRPNEARTLLDERFARGDIDEQEYRARQDLLRSGG